MACNLTPTINNLAKRSVTSHGEDSIDGAEAKDGEKVLDVTPTLGGDYFRFNLGQLKQRRHLVKRYTN